ncbi:MAG: sulfatase-like hydrolase/transferase [Planctomycetota bacterium]
MNFLLIQTAQQRRDCLGVYGNEIVRTPAADALGREGVVFDRAFTTSPICAAARASLITGKRPVHHGILFNRESGSVAGRDFVGEHATLAEELGKRGYLSTLCGKWHVGTDLPPSECGFEGVYFPGYGYPSEHPHYLAYLEKLGTGFTLGDEFYARRPDGSRGPLLAAVQEGPEEASVPHYVVDMAIDAVRRAAADGKPFLVRCDFWGPHAPYIVPERYARMYDPESIPPWPNFEDDLAGKPEIQRAVRRYWGIQDFTWDEWSRLVACCYGYSTLIDDQVACLLGALETEGLAGETAVFYTSDHAGMVGAHGLADKGPHPYDEICRVPLMARVPGCEGDRRSDALCYNMDLMPTILELAGCDLPEGLDARSLTPVLRGEAEAVHATDVAFVEFHGHQAPYSQRAVRTPSAKYVFNAPDIDELYDLEADPGELANLAADPDRAPLLAKMRSLMREQLAAVGDPILRYLVASC